MAMMKGLVSPHWRSDAQEVPVPEIGENPYAPRDVLLEVKYCGICGSDIHRWKADKTGVKFPPRKVVSGHEIVGVVREIGAKVTKFKPGDRVVCEIVTFYCGHCPACREGRYNICNTFPPMEGRAHFMTGGGFAKYTVWPEQQLHKLPDSIGDLEAVLLEPTAGSVHSIITRMGMKAGAVRGDPGARGPGNPDDAGLPGDRGRPDLRLRAGPGRSRSPGHGQEARGGWSDQCREGEPAQADSRADRGPRRRRGPGKHRLGGADR